MKRQIILWKFFQNERSAKNPCLLFFKKSSGLITNIILLFIILLGASAWKTGVVKAQELSYPAQMNKSFSPISISAGGISTLSVKIYNPNSFALTLSTSPAAWTDTLPAGLTFANPANVTTTCGGTVVTSGNKLSLIGGTVPAQVLTTPGSCTVTVNVTSITPGNLVNTIPAGTLIAKDPTDTISITNETPASATLQVKTVQSPTISKTFAPNTIWAGQISLLTITIRNTDMNTDLTEVFLTDNLPSGVTVASAPASSQCGGTVTSTSTSVTLTGGIIPKQVGSTPGSCSITLNVTSVTPDIYTNIIPANSIQSRQGVTNAGAASAPLNVQSIQIEKEFSPDAFEAGDTGDLIITLYNPSSSPYTGVGFTDNLPTGLSVVSTPVSSCGGTPTNTATSISLSGGTIPAGSYTTPGTCTVSAVVTASIAASYTNRIPAGAVITDQFATNELPATDNLTVYGTGLGITGNKDFNPAIIPVEGVSRLSIHIDAPADTDLNNFALSDALPSGIQVAETPAAATSSCGSLVFSPSAGDILLTSSGGKILAGETCTIGVNVTGSTPGTYTNTISSANISNNEHRNIGTEIRADLMVSGVSVSKSFDPATVNPGGISTLTIKLTNLNEKQLNSVSLLDTLPTGVSIASTPNLSTTCGSRYCNSKCLGTDNLNEWRSYSRPGWKCAGICTIVVDVVGNGSAGTYTNTIAVGALKGTLHGTSTEISNSRAASADLKILDLTIGIVKGFDPLTVFGGSISTLTIQLSNPNDVSLDGITFTDPCLRERTVG